jgi:hypothetical protein
MKNADNGFLVYFCLFYIFYSSTYTPWVKYLSDTKEILFYSQQKAAQSSSTIIIIIIIIKPHISSWVETLSRSRIHEHTISMRFLGIILRVLRLRTE